MTQKKTRVPHPVVPLHGLIDDARCAMVCTQITELRAQPGVESVTLKLRCYNGFISSATTLHQFLWNTRSDSGVPVRGIVSGLPGSAATLVLLGLETRLCTESTIFTMRRPTLEWSCAEAQQSHERDEAISKIKHDAPERIKAFYALFERSLQKLPGDVAMLFCHEHVQAGGYSAQRAKELGLVTAIMPDALSLDLRRMAA